MIDELMRIGDEVVITIGKENREWGYNPCPDGTKATILGFSEIYHGRLGNFGMKPGIYVNRAWVKLRLEDGRGHTEWSGRLELTDRRKSSRRLAKFHKQTQKNPGNLRNKEFLRELPETPFWEGDFVRVHGRSVVTSGYNEVPPERDPDVFQVIGIDYNHLDGKTQIGTRYPAYSISDGLGSGWHASASEDNMTLVERGPVWKFYHGERPSFRDIKEEAYFFETLGATPRKFETPPPISTSGPRKKSSRQSGAASSTASQYRAAFSGKGFQSVRSAFATWNSVRASQKRRLQASDSLPE